jgi:Zn-dependent protease with chaperone function
MNDIITETYLDCIQEDRLQEDPLIAAGIFTGIAFIYDLYGLLKSASVLKNNIKMDVPFTKKLNKVLDKSDGYYTVRTIEAKQVNAFTLGGRDLYITTELKKFATEGEIIAILIHEVFHSKSLHILKEMAYTYPMLFICLSVFFSLSVASGASILITTSLAPVYVMIKLLLVYMVSSIPSISYNMIFAKVQEYHADEYTIKYGYEKELISFFKKLKKMEDKIKNKTECEGMCKVTKKVDYYLSQHPETKDRIENLLKKKETAQLVLSNNTHKLLDHIKAAFSS